MQFLVVARDGTDEGAVDRRMQVRPTHLEAIAPLVEDGHVLVGGAILNDDGDMIGSMLLVEFPDRSGVDAWLERDPYVTGDVWRDIDVRPFRAAVGSWQP
ncbi:MAG TPA: YciI family protein [Actinomycetota bacterium]|nr:YciI family protein [Actinomycetota bacterium]